MPEFQHEVAIKICGVTRLDEALACAGLGVDLIGLNFSPRSVRCISAATGAEIIAAVRPHFPALKFVGVFVDQGRELVRKIWSDLALDAVQLHGNETIEDVIVAGVADPGKGARGQGPGRPGTASPATARTAPFVIKALRVGSEVPPFAAYTEHCDAILLDNWSAAALGGTGETFPWEMAAALRPQIKRLILAGGLTSANVGEAIRIVRPFAVDVCSGVEVTPGRKDAAKVCAFVEAVEGIDHEKTAIRA